jgi:hypothetical protein
VQGRIKRGGGGPGDPADREAAIRQQPSQPAPPTSEPGRDPAAGPAGQKHGGPKAGGPRTADAAEARIGRITPTAIGGLRRYGLSNWRIRTRLIALLTLPVIAAIILGGLRIQTSLQSEQQLTKITQLGDIAEYATSLADQLEIERDLLAGALTSGSSRESDNILLQEQTTDTYRRHFITLTDSLNRANLPGGGVDVLAIQESLDKELPSIRNKDFPDGGGSIAQSVSDYDGLIQPLLALSQNLVMESSNSALLESTRAIQVFSQWKEDASTVQSVLTAALASGKPLATQDQAYALTAFNNEKSAQAEFTALYGQAPANNLIKSWASNTNITYANNVANEVLTSPTGFAKYTNILPSYSDWDGDAQSQIGEMTNDETYLVQNLNAQVEQERTQAHRRDHQRRADRTGPAGRRHRRRDRGPLHGAHAEQAAGGRRGHLRAPAAGARPHPVRVGPAGRRHLGRADRHRHHRRDRPRGPRVRPGARPGGPPGRRAGPAARLASCR